MRAFARASGKEAKTDGIDAEVLALYGEVFGEEGAKEEEWDEERRDLQYSEAAAADGPRAREKNRLEKRQSRKAEASIKRAIRWNTNEIGRLDREYKSAGKEQGVEGAGGAVPECEGRGGTDSGNAGGRITGTGARRWEGTDIAGEAPWTRDSGRQRGYRSIQGGRGTVRKALYLERNTEAGKQTGEVLPAARRGKPGKVALVAVMRKLQAARGSATSLVGGLLPGHLKTLYIQHRFPRSKANGAGIQGRGDRRTRATLSRYGQFRHNLRSLFDHNLQTRRTSYAQI